MLSPDNIPLKATENYCHSYPPSFGCLFGWREVAQFCPGNVDAIGGPLPQDGDDFLGVVAYYFERANPFGPQLRIVPNSRCIPQPHKLPRLISADEGVGGLGSVIGRLL